MNSVPKSRDIKEVEDTVANSAKLINNLNNIVAGVRVLWLVFSTGMFVELVFGLRSCYATEKNC